MKESKIETYLRRKVRQSGGRCFKVKAVGVKGWPDRVCKFPGARMCYVETKAPRKKPRADQARVHTMLWGLGFPVMIIDSKALVDSFVQRFSKQ